MKSDLLDGLNSYQRVRRERRDAEFIRSKIPVMVASAASTASDLNTWAGTDVFRREDFREYRKGEKVDAVVCARLDLDFEVLEAAFAVARLEARDAELDVHAEYHAVCGRSTTSFVEQGRTRPSLAQTASAERCSSVTNSAVPK